MKKIISLMLIVLIALFSLAALTACTSNIGENNDGSITNRPDGTNTSVIPGTNLPLTTNQVDKRPGVTSLPGVTEPKITHRAMIR